MGAFNKEYEDYRSKRVHLTQPSHQDKHMLEDKKYEEYRSTRVHTSWIMKSRWCTQQGPVIKTNIGRRKRSMKSTEIQWSTHQGTTKTR